MDAVLNWLWQGCVVAAACFVMLHVLERAHANVRYVVCWAALLLVVALPALPALQSTTPPSDGLLLARSDAIVSLPDTWWTSALVMFAAWMAWASVCTVRFASAMIALRRARLRSRAFPSQVESELPHWSRARVAGRRAILVLSDSVTAAAVLGWGTPMIAVAPALVETLDGGELDRVLIHEWAHVQRRDDLVHILLIVVRIVAGWHPAVWWIDRRLHVEREIACDATAVAITGSPKSYAACLIKLASLRGAAPAMTAAPAVFTASGLRARVTTILSPQQWIAPAWSRTLAVAIVSTLCLMSVALGELQLVASTVFTRPFVPPRIASTTLDRLVPDAMPTLSPASDFESKRSPRQTVSQAAPSAQRPKPAPPSPLPQPRTEPGATPASDETHAPDSTRARDTDAEPAVTAIPASATDAPPEQPDVTAEPPRSPWTAAAAGGTAIGRKSKDAGVATAGAFTRFARRVAGAF